MSIAYIRLDELILAFEMPKMMKYFMTGIIDTQDPEFYSFVANYCVEFSNRFRGSLSKNIEMSNYFNYIVEMNFDVENEKEFHQKELKEIEIKAKNEPYIPLHNEEKPKEAAHMLSGVTLQRIRMLNQKKKILMQNSKNPKIEKGVNSGFLSMMNISKDTKDNTSVNRSPIKKVSIGHNNTISKGKNSPRKTTFGSILKKITNSSYAHKKTCASSRINTSCTKLNLSKNSTLQNLSYRLNTSYSVRSP